MKLRSLLSDEGISAGSASRSPLIFELAEAGSGSLGGGGSSLGSVGGRRSTIVPTASADPSSPPVDIPPLPSTLMTVEQIGGTQFVRIDVAAVRERQAFALTDPLMTLAERHGGRVTMDLTKVAAFSCAWINVLIDLTKRCKKKGGKLVLTGVSTQAKHSLTQMGLAKQFTIV